MCKKCSCQKCDCDCHGCNSGHCAVGMGVVFASVISWGLNHSFWWMLLHALLGWIYIAYWAIWL